MLGSLAHMRPEYRVAEAEMPELERLMLSELARIDELVREAYAAFDFKRAAFALFTFMTVDLSAFYFDVARTSSTVIRLRRAHAMRRLP
jgi:isoleucyl-tRNA synthetase